MTETAAIPTIHRHAAGPAGALGNAYLVEGGKLALYPLAEAVEAAVAGVKHWIARALAV